MPQVLGITAALSHLRLHIRSRVSSTLLHSTRINHKHSQKNPQLMASLCATMSTKLPDDELREPKKIGLVQMTSSADKAANFMQAKALILRAKILGARMVFLPECCDYVAEAQGLAMESAETLEGETVQLYKDLACSQDLWISLGGIHEKPQVSTDGSKKIYNTHLIIDNSGNIRGRYSKTHMFNIDIKDGVRLQETDFTLPGSTIGPPIDTPAGRVGMAICYDLRFPELSIALTQQGADILTYPSAFTVPTGRAHWETLLRSRAIENQCYVIAAAQVGKHNEKRVSYGHAMVVDPWGKVVAECPDEPDVAVVEIDHKYIKRRRQELPVWSHRRHDLYGNVTVSTNVPIDSQTDYQFGQVRVQSDQVFHRSALSFAFVNKKPVVPGHVLLSPVRGVPRFTDMTPAEVADLFQLVQRVSGVIERHYNVTSLTCAIQDGPDAGQTINHVHVHILPRKPGDFQRNDDVYHELDSHDKNVEDSAWRTNEEMSTEAAVLRAYFR